MTKTFMQAMTRIGLRLALVAGLMVASTSTASTAEATALRQLKNGNDSRAWDGVGKLDLGEGSFCTGALISERLVLTAAHCVFDKYTRQPVTPGSIRFLAGLRDGRAAADRAVRRILPHPDFDPFSDLMGEIRHDVAVLELDHPIRNGQIGAFEIHGHLAPGREIGVVSYAQDRAERPAVQEVCEVLGGSKGFLIMSCEADFGASGAPVFVMENGRPAIVSVVSAKATLDGRNVSLGSDVTRPLDEILALVAASDGVFRKSAPLVQAVGETDEAGGAKFLRP